MQTRPTRSVRPSGGPHTSLHADAHSPTRAHVSDASNSPFQPAERAIFMADSFCGALLGIYLTAIFVAAVAGGAVTPAEQVTRFCKDFNISHDSHRQLQDYFRTLNGAPPIARHAELLWRGGASHHADSARPRNL